MKVINTVLNVLVIIAKAPLIIVQLRYLFKLYLPGNNQVEALRGIE